MNFKECRMCGAQQKVSYLFLPGCQNYVDYLSDFTKTQVHEQDTQPPYICLDCMNWLDGHYAMKKKHDTNRRTCQRYPAIAKLKLDDGDPFGNLAEELDVQALRLIPEELDEYYEPINKMQTYRCGHCNRLVKNKHVMFQHLVVVHLMRCTVRSRCQMHCPMKTRYSKVTVYKDPGTDTVIGTTPMATSGVLRKDPSVVYLRADRVLPMPSDDVAKQTAGAEVDVAYTCHKCWRNFVSSWTVEQHILKEHLSSDRCSRCFLHCKMTKQRQGISVKLMKNTKEQDARNEVRYVVGLTIYIDHNRDYIHSKDPYMYYSDEYRDDIKKYLNNPR